MIKLTLPYPPTANHLKTALVIRGRARMVKSATARNYAAEVAAIVQAANIQPITDGDIELLIVVYRPRKVGDLDNCIKIIQDSMKGGVFADDKQITAIHAYRRDDKANPRVEVQLCRVETGGLLLP
ncbi:MAG: RusA family crossover junction endodeoxyribonuclease [Armatimonadetes bacterium]|nr:RusA family crossover junction endodeoxyribonuclease [Armatimonadota bacterium]